MILKIVGTCNDYAIVNIVHLLKNILNLIQIVGPILAIISLVIIFTKLVNNPDDKKLKSKIKNSVFALILLFFVPVIINGLIYLFDDSFLLATCWNYADREIKLDAKYYNEHDVGPSKVISDGADYDKGEKRKDNNNVSRPSNVNISRRIFVGDSRTTQMYAYLTGKWSGANYSSGGVHVVGDDVFICQSGEGLAWMKSTGIPEANKYIGQDSAVIILMGVNDLHNLNEYVKYVNSIYNSIASKGAVVYFDSVNPCTGNYANMLNNKIVSFNNGIRNGLNPNIRYIDSHSNLISTGYNTTDGLHYDKATSDKIYNYIKSNL